MGYCEHLKALLRPMGIYELDSGCGAEELAVIGAQLDDIAAALAGAEAEALVQTAEGSGLAAWEAVLPFYPCYITAQDRRRAIMSLMRIDGRCFTPGALNAALSGCGIAAEAQETDEWYTVRVSFPKNRGVPPNLDELKQRIEAILPCHLAVEYHIILITWAELMEWFSNWSALNGAELTWDGLMRCSGAQ